MKFKILSLFVLISILAFSSTVLPPIEKIEGIRPWWLEKTFPIEGVLEGIGMSSKKDLDSPRYRIIAMELAKREIAGIKNTHIDSTIVLDENSMNKNTAISTRGTTAEDVKAVLIDSYEDENNYYVWMAEFLDEKAISEFAAYLNDKNRKTIENKNQYIKYMNKVVITNKKRSKITINGGTDKGFEKNEILNVYRLTDANLNPLTNELNDFSKEKVGEVVVEEVFDKQALASASLLGTFKVKEGDIVVKSGLIKENKAIVKIEKVDELKKKYDYNLDYEPQVLKVERAKLLSPHQYELSLMSDFNTRTSGDIKVGILRFIEGTISFDINKSANLAALLKVGFPVSDTTSFGIAYKKNMDSAESFVIGLMEYSFYENVGILNLNYTSPIGKGAVGEEVGASVQVNPSKDVLIGMEYVTLVEDKTDNYLALKLNLQVIDGIWLGGGVIWDENREYFMKISNNGLF